MLNFCILIILIFFVYWLIYNPRMIHKPITTKKAGPDAKVFTEENTIAILKRGDKKTVINNNKARKS